MIQQINAPTRVTDYSLQQWKNKATQIMFTVVVQQHVMEVEVRARLNWIRVSQSSRMELFTIDLIFGVSEYQIELLPLVIMSSLWKTQSPILVIDDGIVKEANDVQSKKAALPMLIIDDGNVTEVIDVQLKKT